MKIATKLNLLSIFLLCGYLFMFLYTFSTMRTLFVSMQNIHDADTYLANLNNCDELLLRQLAEGQRILLTDTSNVNGNLLVSLRLEKSKLMGMIAELDSMEAPSGTEKNPELISSLIVLYQTIDSKLIKKIFNNEPIDPVETSELIMHDYEVLQHKLTAYETEVIDSIENTVSENSRRTEIFLIIVTTIFLLMAICLIITVIFLKVFVLGTIKHASEQMSKLSKGTASLDFRFDRVTKDEIGQLSGGFNIFLAGLGDMMGKIKQDGELAYDLGSKLEMDIHSNMELTEDFKNNVNNLDSYFSDLSSAIKETNEIAGVVYTHSNESKAVSINQRDILDETSRNIENTVKNLLYIRTSGLTNLTDTEALVEEARAGFKIINSLNADIQEILNSAEELSSINVIIDDISSRTNILGINAAIEASKAGNSGAGFRVVSSEITNLAALVKKNAEKTNQSLKSVVSAISSLKDQSDLGKDKFKILELNAVHVFESMKDSVQKILELEEDEKKMLGSMEKLSLNGKSISDSVEQMDGNISTIFDSINSLEEDFSSAEKNITELRGGAENLSSLTKRLSIIGEQNHSMADSLKSKIDHFSGG